MKNGKQDDIDLTRKLARLAAELDLVLHDHLVVGREGHFSMREHGIVQSPTTQRTRN